MLWLRVSTMSVVMTVPRGMFTLAYTVGSSVGAVEAGAWRMLNSTITPPKATTASRIPMRRTWRLDRFKANTPEWCDRWHQTMGGSAAERIRLWRPAFEPDEDHGVSSDRLPAY